MREGGPTVRVAGIEDGDPSQTREARPALVDRRVVVGRGLHTVCLLRPSGHRFGAAEAEPGHAARGAEAALRDRKVGKNDQTNLPQDGGCADTFAKQHTKNTFQVTETSSTTSRTRAAVTADRARDTAPLSQATTSRTRAAVTGWARSA